MFQQPASSLTDALSAAVRLAAVDGLLAEFKAEAGDAHRHHIRFVRAMLRAKRADVGADGITHTEADLARLAGTAVRGGFLRADDPDLAGIPLGD